MFQANFSIQSPLITSNFTMTFLNATSTTTGIVFPSVSYFILFTLIAILLLKLLKLGLKWKRNEIKLQDLVTQTQTILLTFRDSWQEANHPRDSSMMKLEDKDSPNSANQRSPSLTKRL